MKKVIVEKTETIAEIADRLLNIDDAEVVLVIPRESLLLSSPTNFRLLAHEAEALGKHIRIESVDEEVLAMAQSHDIDAVHPLFGKAQKEHRTISDIVPPSEVEKHEAVAAETEAGDEAEQVESSTQPAPTSSKKKRRASKRRRIRLPSMGLRGVSRKVWLVALALVLVVVLGGWGIAAAFGSAKVVLHFNKVPWEHAVSLTASAPVKEVDTQQQRIPGEYIESEKNTTQFFQASGRSHVERKASGTITIYNAYSSQEQPLVATTRFLTPDGKLFRLDNQVIVPGARIEDGEIVPSSITASVTADQAGEEFNVDQVERLSIPGFEGSPKYDGFYGALHDGADGGFVGEKAVPTEEDVARARERVAESLRSSFEVTFLSQVPEQLTVPEEANDFTIVDITVNEDTNEEGKFSVLGKARFRAMAFRESDVADMLEHALERSHPEWDLQDISISYENVLVDFADRELSFTASAEARRVPEFDVQAFISRISGKQEAEARSVIQQLPELSSAELLLWPAWVRGVPEQAEDISVVVQ